MSRESSEDGIQPRGPVPVSDVVADVLRRCGLEAQVARQEILSAWPRMVGEKIARQSRVVDLQDGVLLLEADHGAWRQELTLLLPLIEEKYNREFGPGTVTAIQWNRRPPRRRHRDNEG